MKSFEWLHGKLDSVCDWVMCAAVTIVFGIVIVILCMTPFFDDWDEDDTKGE